MKGQIKSFPDTVDSNLILPKIGPNKEEDNKDGKEENNALKDNSIISFSEFSDKNNENEDNSYMEKQLSLLLEVFLTTYSKKTYLELIKDIEEKEILLYKNSIMSFKIMILKVKCLIKILLKEYNKLLTSKNYNFHEMDNIIQKIQHEFIKISDMAINNNSYEFEILTQMYCKFLYLLSKISLKKEDNIKSLGFISLGLNLLKVFIIRKKIASDIKTYKIYAKLMLLLINTLIGDNNYEQALLYSRSLLKIIEASQKFIHKNNCESNGENKISGLVSKKLIKYTGYAFLYIGCCLEQIGDDLQAFEAYKQGKYFLDKGSLTGNPFKNVKIVSIGNSCNFFALEVFEKLNLKFQKEKLERRQRQNKLEKLKRLQKYQLLQNEKQIKLKLIASGYIGDPFKYNKLEEKLDKLLFPTSIQNDLEKIDDELMSFVVTYYNKKKNYKSPFRNKISTNTKRLTSRYELYNILMSKEFRDFVMKNRKLQFNNPKKGSDSISTIQRYLNNKMEIKFELKHRNNIHRKTFKSLEKNNNTDNILNLKIKTKANEPISTITSPTTCPNSGREEEDKLNLNKNLNEKKLKIKFNLMTLPIKEEGRYTSRNKIVLSSSSNHFTSRSLQKKKNNWKNNINELECDFERNNFDKNLMTKNYLKKYKYYDKLSTKELIMQKAFLDFRSNNTIYNAKRALEENDSKILTKEEIASKFMVINEAVKEKNKVVVKDEELEMLKESFISGDNNKISVKMKSAMSKVISKYILERKKQNARKNHKMMNTEDIKQINEKNLLELNYSIKKLNSNISHIRQLAGNKLSDKIYN